MNWRNKLAKSWEKINRLNPFLFSKPWFWVSYMRKFIQLTYSVSWYAKEASWGWVEVAEGIPLLLIPHHHHMSYATMLGIVGGGVLVAEETGRYGMWDDDGERIYLPGWIDKDATIAFGRWEGWGSTQIVERMLMACHFCAQAKVFSFLTDWIICLIFEQTLLAIFHLPW